MIYKKSLSVSHTVEPMTDVRRGYWLMSKMRPSGFGSLGNVIVSDHGTGITRKIKRWYGSDYGCGHNPRHDGKVSL